MADLPSEWVYEPVILVAPNFSPWAYKTITLTQATVPSMWVYETVTLTEPSLPMVVWSNSQRSWVPADVISWNGSTWA